MGRLAAAALAAATGASAGPAWANPKSVPTEKVTPESAESSRAAVHKRVENLGPGAAARTLRDEGGRTGDPVMMMEAIEQYLLAAEQERSPEEATAAIKTAVVTLDLLYFLQDVRADEAWQPIARAEIPGAISKVERSVERAEALIEEIEAERNAPPPPPEAPAKPARKPGTGLIAAGSGVTALGLGGLAIGLTGLAQGSSYQRDVEAIGTPTPETEELDRKGARANTMAIVGLSVGAVATIVGATLIGVGVKKRRAGAGTQEQAPSVRLVPSYGGAALVGRF